MFENSNKDTIRLLGFGRDFHVDLTSIHSDGVSEPFSDVLDVQLGTECSAALVMAFLTFYTCGCGILSTLSIKTNM